MESFKNHCKSNKLKLSQILVSLLLLVLLAYNSVSIFSIRVPFPAKTAPFPATFSPENVAGKSRKLVSVSSSAKISSSMMFAVKEESLVAEKKTLLNLKQTLLHTNQSSLGFSNKAVIFHLKRRHSRKALSKNFSKRVKQFFNGNSSNSSCKFRFFMTWIAPINSFSDREFFCIESLFKSHPDGCLIIVSNSFDSRKGMEILRPFLNKGFRAAAFSPDFNYLFKNTVAQSWLDRLTKGSIDPGEVSLGQNLSNLLRLCLLYKFGGIYIDTDMIVLKRFNNLTNVIGAQTINPETRNWSRLNNAMMIFDKGHPLLYKFIEEFALTFDGNKWGHNGPYLVSRVVSRISGRPGFNNFTVLPPMAFYPVDWSRIGSLFRAYRNETHSKWMYAKLRQIYSTSFAVHLWNKESRSLEIQQGSIIHHIMSDFCIFCNSTSGLGVVVSQ